MTTVNLISELKTMVFDQVFPWSVNLSSSQISQALEKIETLLKCWLTSHQTHCLQNLQEVLNDLLRLTNRREDIEAQLQGICMLLEYEEDHHEADQEAVQENVALKEELATRLASIDQDIRPLHLQLLSMKHSRAFLFI